MFSMYTKHMNKYEMKTNITLLTRKRDALIKKLADIGPFVDGSLVKIKSMKAII